MKKALLLLFAVSLVALLAMSASANTISEYGDPYIENTQTNTCETTARGISITASPCLVASPSGHTKYSIATNPGRKLAIATVHDVVIKAVEHTTEQKLSKIYAESGLKNITIEKKADKKDYNSLVISSKESLAYCKKGAGKNKRKVTYDYKNGTTEEEVLCYDHHDSKEDVFSYESNKLVAQQVLQTIPISKEVKVGSPIKYDGMNIYDLGVANTTAFIDWKHPPFTGFQENRKEYYVISYETDLFGELESKSLTVLDPFFDNSWNNRALLDIFAPGTQDDIYTGVINNDTIIFSLDTTALTGMQSDGDDFRVVHAATEGSQTEIARINLTGWNQAETTIAFNVQNNLTGGINNATSDFYYIYWNNDLATDPGYDANDIVNPYYTMNLSTDVIACYSADNHSASATQTRSKCYEGGWQTATTEHLTKTGGLGRAPGPDRIGNYSNTTTDGMGTKIGAFAFDGDDHWALSAAPTIDANEFAFAAWVKLNSSSPNHRIIRGDGGADFELTVLATTGVPRCGDAISGELSASAGIADDTWHHLVCAAYTNDTSCIFVDGKTANCGPGAGGDGEINLASSMTIGEATQGLIAEPTFWNRSLTAADVNNLYNWTRPRVNDSTDLNVNITVGATEEGSVAPAIIPEFTSLQPNASSTFFNNDSVTYQVNISYTSAEPNDGTFLSGTWYVNGSEEFIYNITAPTANSTYSFNITPGNFSRNSTIELALHSVDNASRSANDVNLTVLTVKNVPPNAPIFDVAGGNNNFTQVRTRKNATFVMNATDHEGDFNYWTIKLNDTTQCGLHNASNSCTLYNMAEGENVINISVFDGENVTTKAQYSLIVDESIPTFLDFANTSITDTTADIYVVADEPVNVSITYGASADCTSFGSSSVRTTFNESTTIQLSGLVAETQYCWRATINDNVTSTFGANNNISSDFNFSFTTNASAGGGGGDSGGSSGGSGGNIIINQVGDKEICNIAINPTLIAIDDETSFVAVNIKNNEEIAYDPSLGIINDSDMPSALSRLEITNSPGSILPGNTAQVGILAQTGIFGGDAIIGSDFLKLEDDRCADMLVPIQTNLSAGLNLQLPSFNLTSLISFDLSELTDGFIDDITDKIKEFADFLSEPIVENVEQVKVWMLLLLVSIILGATFFLSDFELKNKFLDLMLKSIAWIVITPSLTLLLVSVIRNLFGG